MSQEVSSTSMTNQLTTKNVHLGAYRLFFCAVFPWIPVVKTSGTLSFWVKIVEF